MHTLKHKSFHIVYFPGTTVKLNDLNEELRELLVSVSRLTNEPKIQIPQESKDKMVNELEATLKVQEEMIAEAATGLEEMKEKVEKMIQELSEKKAEMVLEIDAGCPNVQLTEEDKALGLTKLEKSNAMLARFDGGILNSRTTIKFGEKKVVEYIASIQNKVDACRKTLADMLGDSSESQMQSFRMSMADVIHRGGDVNEAKVFILSVMFHMSMQYSLLTLTLTLTLDSTLTQIKPMTAP